jgi:hypothetical protein
MESLANGDVQLTFWDIKNPSMIATFSSARLLHWSLAEGTKELKKGEALLLQRILVRTNR